MITFKDFYFTEISISNIKNKVGITSEEVFAYSSEADKIYFHVHKLPDYLRKFGLTTDIKNIKVSPAGNIVQVPIDSEIHGGGLNTDIIKKMIEDLETNTFVGKGNVTIDDNLKTLNIEFTKNIQKV